MMKTARIKMGYGKDEPAPPSWFADHDWIHVHEDELRQRFGEYWIAVYQQQVIGTGKDYHEAIDDAESRLSPDSPVITPVVRSIRPKPIFGFRYFVLDDCPESRISHVSDQSH